MTLFEDVDTNSKTHYTLKIKYNPDEKEIEVRTEKNQIEIFQLTDRQNTELSKKIEKGNSSDSILLKFIRKNFEELKTQKELEGRL